MRYRLLAVDLTADERSDLAELFGLRAAEPIELVPAGARDLAATLADEAPFDLALVGSGATGHEALRAFAELRRRAPLLPIVVIVPDGGVDAPGGAVGAGVATVLWSGPVRDESFERAIATVLARERFQALEGGSIDHRAAAREMQQLRAACGPAPLTAAQKSLGSKPLKTAAAVSFEDMTHRYEELLERALTLRTHQVEPGVAEDLHTLADHLGGLNVGPRDIIELHRVALANRLPHLPAPKAEAMIEEGRLLMIQLMGYVLSYYRARTWGASRGQRRRQVAAQVAEAVEAAEKGRRA